MRDITKEKYSPMHYTVDKLNSADRFIINMYFPDKPEKLATYSANIESIGHMLRHFESLGYIADRIAF